MLKSSHISSPVREKLFNGMTIIVEQVPVEVVSLHLWVNIGSAVEYDDINGISHFLEHMVFKGTERLESGEFERRIEERGAVTNAATSQDYSHYHITTAPRDFADLAPLLFDIVLNASILDNAFEQERLVILEEILRSEDNTRYCTFKRLIEVAFNRSPYKRPILGTKEIISQLKPQQMRDFYKNWYQPISMTAVAVGNLPVGGLIEILAQECVHKLTENGSCRLPKVEQELPFTEIVRNEFIDERLQKARLVILWRVPGIYQLDKTYALDILAGVLGRGRTSRLVMELREERGIANNIYVRNMTNRYQGVFYISTQCEIENIPLVESAIINNIRRLHTGMVQKSEIERISIRVANQFIFGTEKPSDRANLYGYYQSLIGDLEPAFNYPLNICRQTSMDLMQAAQMYLSPDAYGVVAVRPSGN
ncbi:MAG TPA: peptidase M16 [Richelia sp.]|nr:peptidase M16 [Richelia sp.]